MNSIAYIKPGDAFFPSNAASNLSNEKSPERPQPTRLAAAHLAASLARRARRTSFNEDIRQKSLFFALITIALLEEYPCKMPHKSIGEQPFAEPVYNHRSHNKQQRHRYY